MFFDIIATSDVCLTDKKQNYVFLYRPYRFATDVCGYVKRIYEMRGKGCFLTIFLVLHSDLWPTFADVNYMKNYMKNYCIHFICMGVICFAVLSCLAGCEAHELPLPDGNISILDTIYAKGLKGYSIDSTYSEFIYAYNGKKVLLKGLRKGVIAGNGGIVMQENDNATVRYGEGSGDVVYSYGGKLIEIVLNENYFVENATTYESGRLLSKAGYGYSSAGYLSTVRLERPGQTPVTIYYKYPDLQSPSGSDEIVIEEHPGQIIYRIPLSITTDRNGQPARQVNESFVCNVLRYGNSPITNEYVINPDLYYLGLYGVPFKYLPNEAIEWDTRSNMPTVPIVRVGNNSYYY
jgi:hypothetical protein